MYVSLGSCLSRLLALNDKLWKGMQGRHSVNISLKLKVHLGTVCLHLSCIYIS